MATKTKVQRPRAAKKRAVKKKAKKSEPKKQLGRPRKYEGQETQSITLRLPKIMVEYCDENGNRTESIYAMIDAHPEFNKWLRRKAMAGK